MKMERDTTVIHPASLFSLILFVLFLLCVQKNINSRCHPSTSIIITSKNIKYIHFIAIYAKSSSSYEYKEEKNMDFVAKYTHNTQKIK